MLMILRNKKAAGKGMALIVMAILAILVTACSPPLQTSADPSPTQDTQPLVPEASPSITSGPFGSPNASPKAPVPTVSPDQEANLYVLGIYISKPAYVDGITGETMLPMQEALQALGIAYSLKAADSSIELTKEGSSLASIIPMSDIEYDLVMSDEENVFDGHLRLQRKGSTVYAPVYFFEFIEKVDASVNSYGDIFLSRRPEPSPSPSPSPEPEISEPEGSV